MSPISTIYIANRGEIAVRIIRTAKRLGKRVVIGFHESEGRTLPVRLADDAIEIEGESALAAYLSIDNVVAACRKLGADAVHPGFGFLAENAKLASRLRQERICFIGPRPEAIAAMGSKVESKRLAAAAGVATIPGAHRTLRDAEDAMALAHEIGFPVILKASAGGGGRGLRVVTHGDETRIRAAFVHASAEAKATFGDGRLLLERYVADARHIEVQILGDSHGNIVHLGERECSIQRRHQKVIEEAPSSSISEATRNALAAGATALARAVNYESAGTVEFVVDRDDAFFFLEMNTRIQVEHPVTEAVTGIDIVEAQIRIAEGEALSHAQSDIRFDGHAMECRVCAEEPSREFLPSSGTLLRLQFPTDIRVDTGFAEGDCISPEFDSMVAKLVAHAPTREAARVKLCQALDAFVALGVNTNCHFLHRVLESPQFIDGTVATEFVEGEFARTRVAAPSEQEIMVALAAAALANRTLFDERFAPPANSPQEITNWSRPKDSNA